MRIHDAIVKGQYLQAVLTAYACLVLGITVAVLYLNRWSEMRLPRTRNLRQRSGTDAYCRGGAR